jgi:hypothetical protein
MGVSLIFLPDMALNQDCRTYAGNPSWDYRQEPSLTFFCLLLPPPPHPATQPKRKKKFALMTLMLATFLIAVTKYLTKQPKKRKDLFWLMVSESSVCGYLAPCFWA